MCGWPSTGSRKWAQWLLPPSTAGMPNQPAATAPTASSMSGMVTTRGDSCRCSRWCSVPRNSPWKMRKNSRNE